MVEPLTELREKLIWLSQFLDLTGKSINLTSNNLLEAIQIPRNAIWKDEHILNIVEISNKHRILLDEKHALFQISILTDIKCFIDYMNEVFGDIHSEYRHTEISLENLSQQIQNLKEKLENLQQSKNEDPWFYMCNIKKLVKLYDDQKEQVSFDIKRKMRCLNDEIDELNRRFCKIFENYCKIEESYHEKIYEIFREHKTCYCDNTDRTEAFFKKDIEENGFLMSQKFDLTVNQYDFIENENEIYENELSLETDKKKTNDLECIESIFPLLDGLPYNNNLDEYIGNMRELCPIKHGIFKFRKFKSSKWVNAFIVFTQSNFMHVFELNAITKTEHNLRVKHSSIISRLSQTEKRKGFFNRVQIVGLNLNEENELKNLSNDIMEIFNHVDSLIYSVKIGKEIPRLDKDYFEIIIEFKGIKSFTDIFFTKIIRIRAFLLTELYDLYSAITNKKSFRLELNEKEIEDVSSNIKEDETVEKKLYDYDWMKYEDNNPWNEP